MQSHSISEGPRPAPAPRFIGRFCHLGRRVTRIPEPRYVGRHVVMDALPANLPGLLARAPLAAVTRTPIAAPDAQELVNQSTDFVVHWSGRGAARVSWRDIRDYERVRRCALAQLGWMPQMLTEIEWLDLLRTAIVHPQCVPGGRWVEPDDEDDDGGAVMQAAE